MNHFFSDFSDCSEERIHICKYDTVPSQIQDFARNIMSIEEENIDAKLVRITKSPELTELYHSSKDFEKAIEY